MNIINITGEIGWDVMPDDIKKQLAEANGKDIEVHIASPGGFVFDGIEIFNAFRDYKKQYPKCQMMLTIKGLAASMASYLAVNPAFDLVAAEDNAVFMIHNAWGGAVGDYREMKKSAEVLEGISDLLGQAYSKKTGKKKEEIKKCMDEESWYFGSEILEHGFVDDIIKAPEKIEKESALASGRVSFNAMNIKLNEHKTDIQKLAAIIQPENPYPNEHAARIKDPDEFEQDSFRRKNIDDGIDIIIGRLKGETSTTTQAYRFKSAKFTADEAKKWLSDHDIKYISFEAASDNTKDSVTPAPSSAGENNNITGGVVMTLEELKSQHPALYAEIFKAGYDKGKSEMIEISSKAAVFASSKEYPEQVKAIALDVMQGKKSMETLDTLVANADMIKEMLKSKHADDEQKDGGNAQQEPVLSQDGTISSMADLKAEAARLKGGIM